MPKGLARTKRSRCNIMSNVSKISKIAGDQDARYKTKKSTRKTFREQEKTSKEYHRSVKSYLAKKKKDN